MEPAASVRLGYGRTAMLRGMVGAPARAMMKTTTLHYSRTFYGGRYSCRPCHDMRMVPIVRAKVEEEERRWVRKAERAGVASSVVLACVVGMMSLGLSSNWRAMSAVNQALAVMPGTGGESLSDSTRGLDARSAINALMEVSMRLFEESPWYGRSIDAKVYKWPKPDPNRGPSKDEISLIKMKAMLKVKAGHTAEAMQLLEEQYHNWKVKGGEVKYNMEMALVEMLIAQGKYDAALDYDCMKEDIQSGPSDPRNPLYKAIIYTAKREPDIEKAKENWNKFMEHLGRQTGKPE